MERKTYIDVAKGIAMLLVVMQHTGGTLDSCIRLLCKVDVPLFFLCSGYLAYKSHIDILRQIKKNTIRILVPFVFAIFFASVYYNENIVFLFSNIGKRGYWFLEALFLMLLLFMLIYKNGKRLIIGGCLIEFLLLLTSKYAPCEIDGVLGFSYMSRYFPCLIMGVLLRKYSFQGFQNRLLGLVLILTSLIGLGFDFESSNVSFLAHVIGYVSAAVLAFFFIKDYAAKLPICFQKALAYTGRYSLNIYIIHFYFVFTIPHWGGYFIVDLIVSLFISMSVIFISIVIGKILTYYTYLNKILTP